MFNTLSINSAKIKTGKTNLIMEKNRRKISLKRRN